MSIPMVFSGVLLSKAPNNYGKTKVLASHSTPGAPKLLPCES